MNRSPRGLIARPLGVVQLLRLSCAAANAFGSLCGAVVCRVEQRAGGAGSEASKRRGDGRITKGCKRRVVKATRTRMLATATGG